MRVLSGDEAEEAKGYLHEAEPLGQASCCLRTRCGALLVKDGVIIGTGFNSPPGNEPLDKCLKDDLPEDFVSDKTCCIHAEDRAVRDALARNPERVKGSVIYFAKLDKEGKVRPSGEPYCTICSKLVLDVGIKEFVMQRKQGICAYDAREYNEISFKYREENRGP